YSMIRVAIADDHPEMRIALRLLLELSKELEVVCEADNGQEALDCVQQVQPDVLVMDVQMPGLDGFEVTKLIGDLGVPTRVILISIYKGSFYIKQAEAVGARGFVLKDNLAVYLRRAIDAVYRGKEFFLEEDGRWPASTK
ncbi:MAG: response regulator, partial [Anaerolineales bacterium]